MSSSALIERKYYSLYIGNLSRDIRQRDLAEYLERFDQVDQIQLFEANYRRWTSFAFVLMRTPDSINRLMATRPHFLNNRRLYLKRALPDECSNKIEHLMSSENVLIRFKDAEKIQINEPYFNEENIRNYFQTYGTILNLYLLKNDRCVIEFQDYDSVDCILLDSPHYFNGHELQIDKYYSTDQLKTIERMFLQRRHQPEPAVDDDEEQMEPFLRSRRHLLTRQRLLKDSILSIKISNEIKLETIEKGFLATINRRKELLERIAQLNQQCEHLRERNSNIADTIRDRVKSNKELENRYQDELLQIRSKQERWEEKIGQIDHGNEEEQL